MNKQELEQQALQLIQSGKTNNEVEKELQHEFIFYKDAFTGKYVRATFWK